MSTVASAIAGVAFGLAMAAPPGPMNAVIAEESALRGFPAGVRAGMGAMAGDVLFCVLALVGVATVVAEAPWLQTGMIAAGGALMCWFAYGAARSARASFTEGDPDADTAGFRKAFALSVTNPYQIVFWLTVGVGLLAPGELDVLSYVPRVADLFAAAGLPATFVIRTGSPALLAGFFAGILAWVLSYPAAVAAAGERFDRAAPAIASLSALVLAGFGVAFLLDAARDVVVAIW